MSHPKPSERSPRRKSLVNRASFIERKNENDDEAERAALLAEDRSKASSSQFSTPHGSTRSAGSSVSSINTAQKEHFQGCLKLFAENKINKDNAWNLQLIDYMTTMLRIHDSRMENLQMASTTLDASTRIYSFRVDAVHHDVLKMAGGLAKATQVRRGKKPDGEDDEENTGDNSADGEGNTQRKNKKKKSSKGSLSTNIESQLNGEVEINECIDAFFAQLAATTGDMTSSNRAFNATLPVDDKTLGLILRSDLLFLDLQNDSKEKDLDLNQLKCFEMKKNVFPLVTDKNDQICEQFHGFSLTNWDPEDEEANMKTTSKWVDNNLNLSQQAMAFDMNAEVEPLANDNMSHHFFDNDDDHRGVESDEEEVNIMKHAVRRDKTNMVACLVDMRPSLNTDAFLEYSYSSAVIGSWAGPSHWKLKNNVNKMTRIAEKRETLLKHIVKKAPSRKKKQLDFLVQGMSFNRFCVNCPQYSTIVPNKIMVTQKTLVYGSAWSEKNFITPVDLGFNLLHFKKLYLKESCVLRTLREEQNKNNEETAHHLNEIVDYDYNNDNDTSYCRNSQDDGGAWQEEENEEMAGDVHNQNNLIDCNGDMVEPPAKVAKIFIPYAMRAKKVDMKQLKQVSWKMLTYQDGTADKENDPNGCIVDHVRETNFKNLYKKLPLKLSNNMKESLSVSLSLLAVLHLANEKGLLLKKNADFTDFMIYGEEKF